MGSDDKDKGAKGMIAEEGKALVGKAYDDAAKPAVVQVGKTLGLAVEVALSPVNLILGGIKAAMGRLSAAVEKKLGGIPPERLLPPPATIAAPAALHYALLGEGDEVAELREMFENLLATSMDRDTADGAHPAFVSMISQLTPDEARILKSIDRPVYEYINLGSRRGLRTLLGVDIGINEALLSVYVGNLVRLGIFSWHEGATGSYTGASSELRRRIAVELPNEDVHLFYVLYLKITSLGRQFLEACANVKLPLSMLSQ